MRLALIGVGLIGASAAWGLKQKGVIDFVSGFDLNEQSVRQAQTMGIADHVAASIEQAVDGADCVLVAVPVRAMAEVFAHVAAAAADNTWITDVGSTRQSVIAAARENLGEKFANYTPVHPIAGGEMPGVAYARVDLFEGKRAVVTVEDGMREEAVAFWQSAWSALGARLVHMSAQEHDAIFARVSHLPHLLSYTMVASLLHDPQARKSLQFAGAGFRDFTRIAASSPVMWTDITLANREAILQALSVFEADVAQMRRDLEAGDAQALMQLFETASGARRKCVF